MSAGFVVKFGHLDFFTTPEDAQVLLNILPRCTRVYSRWEDQKNVYYKDRDQALSFESVVTFPENPNVQES